MVTNLKLERRNDIDWLRILAVLLLAPFHSALIFVLNPRSIMYVKDMVNSESLDRMAGFIHQFHMPLLFVLAGASTWFALHFRNSRQYIKERVLRLLIPFIFGVVVLLPPMTYITRIARGENISFLSHFLGFFRLNPADLAGYYGTLTPAHLWFIMFLFIFSLVGLPLFLHLLHKSNKSIQIMAGFFEQRFALFLLAIPIALLASFNILDDKNPLVYFFFFFLGFLLMTDERYQKAIDRDYPVMLFLGIVFEIIRQNFRIYSPEWSLPWISIGLMEVLNRWIWVLVFLGLGHRFLKNGGPVLRYLSEAAFPFYLLHLPLNTLVGYFIIKIPTNVAVKYLLVVSLTISITFMVYEICRWIPPLRFLLGIKKAGIKIILKKSTSPLIHPPNH